MSPWELNADLERENLIEVGQIIRDARRDALELHDEDAGDDNWSLGCRAYAFCKNRIADAADEGRLPWLSIVDRSLEFVFQIGRTPLRVFRSDGEESAAKFLRTARAEVQQQELELGDDLSSRLHWRFVIETDIDGAVVRIVLLGLTSAGETRCLWEVPPMGGSGDGGIQKPDDIGPHGGAVDIPAPVVQLRKSAGEAA